MIIHQIDSISLSEWGHGLRPEAENIMPGLSLLVVSDIMKGLESLVSRFAVEFERHRRKRGSDSATGSNDDDEEPFFGDTVLAMQSVVAPLSSP